MLNFWKPWYVYRPAQLVTRIFRELRSTYNGPVTITLPWGVDIEIDPSEDIGRSLWTTGIYDLAVSEVLYRLTARDSLAVDVGANIGYMTSLLACRVGKNGRVLAFEPNPKVLPILKKNVANLVEKNGHSCVEVHPLALSDSAGIANLVIPEGFEKNQGIGRIGAPDCEGVDVETQRLDELLPSSIIHILKLDVEGHEASVLRGASGLLRERRICHIVFEDHEGYESEACRFLDDNGYTLFQIGWVMKGPVICQRSDRLVARPHEAVSYLATLDPEFVLQNCEKKGWQLFGGKC